MAWITRAGTAGLGGVVVPVVRVIVAGVVGFPESPPVQPREPAARVRAVASVPRLRASPTARPVPPPTPPATPAIPAAAPGTPVPVVATPITASVGSCSAALEYLAGHQAPGFVAVCAPGSALGHYGYTCWNTAPYCPNGGRVIHIACPEPFVYMNEAHNSWTLTGTGSGIDPFGQGDPAQQAACNQLR